MITPDHANSWAGYEGHEHSVPYRPHIIEYDDYALEHYAWVGCYLPKRTYEELSRRAAEIDQDVGNMLTTLAIESAMRPNSGKCCPDSPPQWRRSRRWYCHTCGEHVEAGAWHMHEPAGRPAEMRCTGQNLSTINLPRSNHD